MNLYIIIFALCGVAILVLFYIYLKAISERDELKIKYAILRGRYKDEVLSSKQKIEFLTNAKDELSREFKELSNQIFEDKTQKLNYTNKEHIEMLLKPFREQITDFSIQSREQFIHEEKERYLLKDEILRLKEMSLQLSEDAINLTNALKGDNKMQGNWGEMVLEKILEDSGLRLGKEYEVQVSLKSLDAQIFRPDVVLHMPQNRDVIIDAKVSLVAYERYMKEENEEEKQKFLKEHLNSIKSHIKNLSEKNYEKLDGINTLDYVLLFIPIESAFMLALKSDAEFFKDAYNLNILIVSPSTLLVTLKTIEHIWRTQKQQENAIKIVNEAEAMYDKLLLFVDEMHKLGSTLQKAQESYQISMNRLSSGKGNVIKRVENMVELGLNPKKKIDIIAKGDEL
jgi:DNA recombination protein RmuC